MPLPPLAHQPVFRRVLNPSETWEMFPYPFNSFPPLECHISPPLAVINGGPKLVNLDLDAISLLSGLEDLNLGIGVSLGKTGVAVGAGNCHVTGGIQLTDLGVAKLAKLTKLRRLDISGARITPAGLNVLKSLPQLERLSLWNCTALDDSAASEFAAAPKLVFLDLSYTSAGDGIYPVHQFVASYTHLFGPSLVNEFRAGVGRLFIDGRNGNYGVNVADVENVVQAAVGGQAATQVIQGEKLFDLVVRM